MTFRRGTTRWVILAGPYAVKVPRIGFGVSGWINFLEGLLSNIQEANVWECAKVLGTTEMLCPVVFRSWGGWFIVMKRVQILTEDEAERPEIEQIESRYGSELKHINYGWLGNRIVAVDYGKR